MALSLILGLMSWTVPGITNPAPAVADAPSDDTFVRNTNDLYAWVDAGENLDATFTKVAEGGDDNNTIITVTAPDGATQDCVLEADSPVDSTCDFADLTTDAAGIWQINARPDSFPGDQLVWDITAQNGNTDLPGRVWSLNYTMRNLAPVDVSVYYLNEQGFLYQANYSDYNGQDSNLVVDSVGNTLDGTCTSAYTSYDYGTPDQGFPYGDEDQYDTTRLRNAGTCGDVYKIFFAEPAADLPTTGQLPDGTTTWIRPELVLPEIASVDFDETGTDERSGTFTVNVDNFTGQAAVEIDVDGNGEYADPIDRQLPVGVVDGVGIVEFDGLDGNGETINSSTDLSARAYIDRVGEIHFVNWDVEQRGGLEVTALNGPASGALTLYWDDTALRTADRDCTTPQIDGTTGVNSAGGVHGWDCDTSANDGIGGSWGDYRYIDDWTYQPIDEQLEVDLPGRQLAIEKTADADDATRIGDTVTYTVTITNSGGAAYTEDDPASFIDDLSGVLDDAEYNDDAEVSAGAVSYDSPRLSWSGALDPGVSVTLSYSVTLNGAGDTEVDNVAFVTVCTDCDPPTPPAEVCADAGTDPETGLPCAPVGFDLPKLSVEKSADRTELPTVGDTVTYTVTATNTGAGDYSADNPATVLDDVTDVLDDATVDETSIAVSSGTATYAAPMLTWNGPLAAGETVTITYLVTYTGAGDSRLVNVAWAPTDPENNETPECNPADENGLDPETGEPCGRVAIPAADLEVQKSVDPQDGSTVQAGQELTYTITFANLDGTIAADVDGWSDDLSRVLDDAELIEDPAASDGNLTVSGIDDGAFTVDGSVPAGESYTVTYSVKVLPDGERGDQVLDNFVVQPGEDPPNPGDVCADDDPLCTTNPVPQIEIDKTVDPETGTPVESGQVLTYTLSFTNTGTAAGEVDKVDDLSHLLDDAEVTQAPVASDGALMVSEIENQQFAITGSLEPGQTVTVSYQATVNAAENLGDADLANFVINPGDNPPDDPECTDALQPCTENPAPKVTDAKSVDPEDGTTVESGETLTYTLTFTNEGKAPGQVDKVDDLTHVLDDADVVSGPVASDEAVAVSDITEGRYAITGTLAPGQTVTVSYDVTVRAQDELGDTQLANFLMNPDDPTPEDAQDCETDDPDCTYNPVPKIIDSKTVDPESGTSVKAGQELTYTLTFTNAGQGTGTINRVDDLTHILDDAKITQDPAASDEALTVADIDDHRLAISGTLKPGQTATVSYTVTVNEAADLGDSELANFLLDPEDPTPDEPVCDGDDCTYNPVSNITVGKQADPESGETVDGGQSVQYVLSFHNTGKADGAVDYTDHLGGVLDDAEIVGDVTSSDPALTAGRDGKQVAITGTLTGGQTVKITYQVKVKAYADQGDHLLGNFVTVTGQEPPTQCADGSNLCTEHPTKEGTPPAPEQPGNPGNPDKPGDPGAPDTSPSGWLAQTGAASVLVPAALIGLLLTGASAWMLTRRRQAGIGAWVRKS